MKKWLASILLAAMVFSTLTACSGDTQSHGENEVEQNQEEQVENEYRDMYEAEFWGAYFIGTAQGNFFWPEPTTASYEHTRNISEQVETLLNCKLLEEGFPGLGTSNFAAKMAVGDYQFSFTHTTLGSPVSAYYEAGFIQSWDDISCVDLSNEALWGTPQKQKMMTFGGHVYAETGPDSISGAAQYGRMFYNKILAQELNPNVLPQEMYEQDNWTWASFEEYLKSVEIKEADRTVYGMSLGAHSLQAQVQFPLAAIFSNGGEIVRTDDSGNAYFALTDSEAIEALDWAAHMISSGLVVADTEFPPDIWATKGAVFILGDTSYGTASSGSSKHWGLDNLEDLRCMPFPHGPKGNASIPGSYATGDGGNLILYGVDKEDAGYVWTVRKTLLLESQDDTLEEWKRKTFFQDNPDDNDSYDNYVLGSTNYNLDYSGQIGDKIDTLRDTLFSVIMGTKTPMEGMTGISATINDQLNKTMNAN